MLAYISRRYNSLAHSTLDDDVALDGCCDDVLPGGDAMSHTYDRTSHVCTIARVSYIQMLDSVLRSIHKTARLSLFCCTHTTVSSTSGTLQRGPWTAMEPDAAAGGPVEVQYR